MYVNPLAPISADAGRMVLGRDGAMPARMLFALFFYYGLRVYEMRHLDTFLHEAGSGPRAMASEGLDVIPPAHPA